MTLHQNTRLSVQNHFTQHTLVNSEIFDYLRGKLLDVKCKLYLCTCKFCIVLIYKSTVDKAEKLDMYCLCRQYMKNKNTVIYIYIKYTRIHD